MHLYHILRLDLPLYHLSHVSIGKGNECQWFGKEKRTSRWRWRGWLFLPTISPLFYLKFHFSLNGQCVCLCVCWIYAEVRKLHAMRSGYHVESEIRKWAKSRYKDKEQQCLVTQSFSGNGFGIRPKLESGRGKYGPRISSG